MNSAPAEAGFDVRDARTGQRVDLAMQHLHLQGEVLPFGACFQACHRFVSGAAKPLEVVYAFALPRDAALRRFRVEGEGFSVTSALKPVEEATEEYERGVAAGSLSTLARAYRDGLVNLSLGNLRPGETVTVWLEIVAGVACRDDGARFRFPFTLAPSYHPRGAWTRTGGELEGELPRDEFGDLLLPPLRKDSGGLHQVSFDLKVVAGKGGIRSVASPSHPLRVSRDNAGRARVQLGVAADTPNRDLVLDAEWEPASRLFTQSGPDGQVHFAAMVPSAVFAAPASKPRRVVLLLDRSGSMNGEPLIQARKAVAACLAALEAEDRFGLVAFDDKIDVFQQELLPAAAEQRAAAAEFLAAIQARGGTELAAGVEAAANLLRGGDGEIFVLTDGQVLGTAQILAKARAAGVRLHVLGIGSASQDRFLASLARETGGVDRFVTPRERVDLAAVDLFASASVPVAEDVRIRTDGITLLPEPPSRVFAGQPLMAFGEFAGDPPVVLAVSWSTGSLEVPFAEAVSCDGVMPVRGARLITETEDQAEDGKGPRAKERVRRALEFLSSRFGLASQAMALVAVIQRKGDQPGALPVTQVVPLALPESMEMPAAAPPPVPSRLVMAGPPRRTPASPEPPRWMLAKSARARFSLSGSGAEETAAAPPSEDTPDLVVLAGRLAADGGMPGAAPAERVARTLLALAAFAEAGHTRTGGAFRRHVRRMISFLESGILEALPADLAELARRALDTVRTGIPPGADWLPKAWAAQSAVSPDLLWSACRGMTGGV